MRTHGRQYLNLEAQASQWVAALLVWGALLGAKTLVFHQMWERES